MEHNKRKREIGETLPYALDVIVFHKNCADGFACACACYMYYDEREVTLPTLIELSHSDPVPMENLSGKRIAIFDFSFKRDVMMKLLDSCITLSLWDHHDTAEKELVGVPNCHFSKYESGAILAWKFFFGDRPIPEFIKYVDDADRWQFKLPRSRDIRAGVFSGLSMTFDKWVPAIEDDARETLDRLADAGVEYTKFIKGLGEGKAKYSKEVKFFTHTARVVNCPFFVSQMAEMILDLHPKTMIAIVWDCDHVRGRYRVHLRSRQSEGIDVGNIASRLGGGGHVNASAFTLKENTKIEDLWK